MASCNIQEIINTYKNFSEIPTSKLQEFSTSDWIELIKKYPEAERTAKNYTNGWLAILLEEPYLAHECDKWNEFTVYDWRKFLSSQPQFEENAKACGYNPDTGEFDVVFDKDDITSDDVEIDIEKISEFVVNVWSRDDEKLFAAFKSNPPIEYYIAVVGAMLGGTYPYAAAKNCSEIFLKVANQLIDEFYNIGDEENADISLSDIESLGKYFNAVMFSFEDKTLRNTFYNEIMENVRWSWLPNDAATLWQILPDFAVWQLLYNPQDADQCLCFNAFKGYHWCALLIEHPEFRDIALKYEGFRKMFLKHDEEDDGSWHVGYLEVLNYWGVLLSRQPSFKDLCEKYHGFDHMCSMSPNPPPSGAVEVLIEGLRPRLQLIGYDDDELTHYYQTESGWLALLKSTKDFDALCDKLKAWCSLSEKEWDELVETRPELAEKRAQDWSKAEEEYPFFDFDNVPHESDDWNEYDVGGVFNPNLYIEQNWCDKIWEKVNE